MPERRIKGQGGETEQNSPFLEHERLQKETKEKKTWEMKVAVEAGIHWEDNKKLDSNHFWCWRTREFWY